MPVLSTRGQPELRPGWFASGPALALLASEHDSVRSALAERPGQPWLWLSAAAGDAGEVEAGPGLRLQPSAGGWSGSVRCALPLPLANESVAAVVVQHLPLAGKLDALLAECARVLVPGGHLSLFCLNPLSPWRWRWAGGGPGASEPLPWRRRLRAAGLVPEPVSQGLGPRWGLETDPALQHGPGLRAAWLLRAQKRVLPLTPLRNRAPMRIGGGVPAA